MKVKQGRHSLPDISIFSVGQRIWTLPGGVEKWLSFGREAVKNVERIPAFCGRNDPLKTFFHQKKGLYWIKRGDWFDRRSYGW
jgi:hypothetical protein